MKSGSGVGLKKRGQKKQVESARYVGILVASKGGVSLKSGQMFRKSYPITSQLASKVFKEVIMKVN